MAHVLLLSAAAPDANPVRFEELSFMKRSAACDKFGVHHLTDDPEYADVILFVENTNHIRHYLEVRRHPHLKAYREKCFIFGKYDYPLPFLPGIYTSVEKPWYDRRRTRAGGYQQPFGNDYPVYDPTQTTYDYLYSFIGAASNHPVRGRLFALDHDAQYLFDTAQLWPYNDLEPERKNAVKQRYQDVCRHSKFILCPRGLGASSIRLYESMKMGRAPVIISDAWVSPDGPDWKTFSLRISEAEVFDIPRILSAHEQRAEELGHLAREAWEDWFSAEATFHRVVEWCLDIARERTLPEAMLRYSAFPQLLRPLHARALAKTILPKRLVRQLQQLRPAT